MFENLPSNIFVMPIGISRMKGTIYCESALVKITVSNGSYTASCIAR
jgi:hypothetical protein